jgi:hypothetical protein
MAHAKPSDLIDIEILLTEIRKVSVLKEKSTGCFYFKSKGVLHFHTKDERRYAHVFDGKTWHEVDINKNVSGLQQKKIFTAISKMLPIK